MSLNQMLSPLLLSQVSSVLTSSNSRATIQPFRLMNPNRSAMLIDQFRFLVETASTALFTDLIARQITTEILYGSLPLTNGFVPINCPLYFTVGDRLRFAVTWHLPRPLYVPPNVQITINLARNDILADADSLSNIDATVRATIVGRSMPSNWPIPPKVFAPWHTAAVFTTPTTATTRTRFTTQNNQLANPFNEDMRITRVLGYFRENLENFCATYNRLTVQMTFSNNRMLVRDPVPMDHLFPLGTHFFDVDATLKPKEYIRAIVDWIPSAPGGDYQESIVPLTLGFVGYHEVQTPQGG